jgi:hypothetical protein
MNIRWLFGNFADPEFRLTRAQQREVTRLAHRKYLPGFRLTIWTIAMGAGGWALMFLTFKPLASFLAEFSVPSPWVASGAIICVAVGIVAAWLYRSLYRRPVYRAMRDLGYDLCLECGYRLQGLDESITQCPECGTKRQIMETLSDSPHS